MKKNIPAKSSKMAKERRKRHFTEIDEEYDEDDDMEEEDDEEEDDEIEEDEDDEEEDDDEEDDDEEEIDEETLKRMRRRKRRIRNQILAYGIIVVVIGVILAGGFLGGRSLLHSYQEKKQEKELAAKMEEMENEPQDDTEVMIETPEEEEVVEEVSPLDEIVNARIAEMPLEDKVAALFMVTPEQLTGVSGVTKAGDTTKKALEEYKVGGIIYTADNIKDEDQLKELLGNTALIDQTLFLAVNEEGGENSIVGGKLSVDEVLDMETVGANGDSTNAYQAGATTGAYLASYGFNLNLAPVADVKISEESVLGSRSFGTDAETVGQMAASYVQGLTENGVSACVKTFPGLGGVTESTADGMADTERTQSDMESSEFIAYRAAIEAGSEFVMVGTISAPNLTGDNTPCCLSKVAVDLLRDNLGFDGIVLTGALNETAVTDYHTASEAAEKAIKAGADMIYMPENFKEAYEGLLAAVQNGDIEESRIDESLLRIYRVKYKDKLGEAENMEEDAGGGSEEGAGGNTEEAAE